MFAKVEKQRNGIELIKIDNQETTIVFSNYGARIVSWKFDDNSIVLGNIVEADEFYQENPFKFGATIGRYSGRIANATFELDGKTYTLDQNDESNNIHGGPNGLDSRFFEYEIVEQVGQIKIIFTTSITSEEDNFPGNIELKVTHTYNVEHKWTIEYEAVASEKTLFNPMNHVYFNLNRDNNIIDNHYINSDKLAMYPLGDDNLVSSLEPIDLKQYFGNNKIKFKDIFEADHPVLQRQMNRYKGLDHPFEIDEGQMTIENKHFLLKVETDMPNVVVFTFNDTSSWQSNFNIYKPHSGFTLETQCIPNDINLEGENAQSIIDANKPFYSKTSYKIFEKEI